MSTWAYGVTTVSERRDMLLPRTLASLAAGGFDGPRLFVDGPPGTHCGLGADVTYRGDNIRAFGNFYLAMLELLIREPAADRYAVFQDDLVTYKNLRGYLDTFPDPPRGYWNLYTFPHNLKRCGDHEGWSHSDQMGRGAVALVFSRDAARTLMTHHHMLTWPEDKNRGWKKIDGRVVETMKSMGYKEYVHNPSLVQHTGDDSSIGNARHLKADSFRGEEYDALDLLAAK